MAMDSTMSYLEIVEEAELFFDENGRGAHSGYKSFKRWQYWAKRCLDGDGMMLNNAAVFQEFSSFQANSEDLSPQSDGLWAELGPYQVQNSSTWSSHIGRITSLALDPNDENHLLVGSPTGGIWKSINGGQSWEPIYDFQSILKIFSLAINPAQSDDYFAGTWGGGIQRSRDGGQTWAGVRGIPTATRIIDIKFNPHNPNQIVAINEGGNIFTSLNGGDNWRSALTAPYILYDIAFSLADPNIMFVSGANAVYKSSDLGISFQEIDGPWKWSGMTFNPIMMETTPACPNCIYALEGDNGGFGNLYLSEDLGLSWTRRSSDENGDNNLFGYSKIVKGGQAPRDMDIAVSTTDRNEIHVGGVMTHRSMNGGINWTQTTHWLRDDPLPFIHADIDLMVYSGDRLYVGTDGGLFMSEDSGQSFTDLSTGLNIRQFYRMDVSSINGEHLIVAGSQDNGAGKYSESEGWVDFLGADGMEPIIDKEFPNEIYASIQFGNIYKTKDGGWTLVGGFTQTPGFGDWVTPLAQDPVKSRTLYQGKTQLYETTDGAVSWTPISDFNNTAPYDTLMQEMDVFRWDGKNIVVGFAEQIYRTLDGGNTWQDISPEQEFTNVNYISIHPTDKNWIVVTLSGTSERVMQTTDGGQTWTSLMKNLPKIGAECVIYEGGPKNGIYLSMDPGIFYINNDRSEWQLVSDNVPNVRVTELAIADCTLYATTFGRGLWSTHLFDDSVVYLDADGDGYGDAEYPAAYCQSAQGYVTNDLDCNDSNPNVFLDSGNTKMYRDADGDGYGAGDGVSLCDAQPGYVSNDTDCDDTDDTVYPGAAESCDDLDNNCNGTIDEGAKTIYYQDSDNDGYGNEMIIQQACSQPAGFVTNDLDCDDTDSQISPLADEICDGTDNNCDGLIDDLPMSTYYIDSDGDGYGSGQLSVELCLPQVGYVTNDLDCDDTLGAIYPGAPEICDGLDNDCDGFVDEEGLAIYYRDADGDGYGDALLRKQACSQPSGYVLNDQDCDDNNDKISPLSDEICDGIDNNCDGLIDDLSMTVYFADNDGDGYGHPDNSVELCQPQAGYVTNDEDCDDTSQAVNPDAIEICDGLDNDCDGLVDETCQTDDEPRCTGNFLFINAFVLDTFRANSIINTNAKVNPDQHVLITAEEEIIMQPEFEVPLGAIFEARISPCKTSQELRSDSGVVTSVKRFDTTMKSYFKQNESVVIEFADAQRSVVLYHKLSLQEFSSEKAMAALPSGEYYIKVLSDINEVVSRVTWFNDVKN